MVLNYLALFLVTVGGGSALFYNIRKTMTSTNESDEDFESEYTISYLVDYVKEQFANYMKTDLQEANMTQKEYNMVMDSKVEMRRRLKSAAYGNKDAKEYIKASISDMLQKNHKVDETTINKFIKFDNISQMSSVDMTEILIYCFNKYCAEQLGINPNEGLSEMIGKYHLADIHKDDSVVGSNDMIYDISPAMIQDVYEQELADPSSVLSNLDYNDKLAILSQRVFEHYKGFGCADLLLDSSIDEIDCGVSGIPQGSYEINQSQLSNVTYSYESIWIMYHGLNVKMSCLYFESQAELIRVCQNIYRYEAPTVLSRKEGRVVSTMADGSRIVVVRPPFADSYAFFARHLGNISNVSPEQLFKNPGAENIERLLKWIIRGHRNIIYSGSQGTGKTTTMKAYVKYIPVAYNIRVQELTPELNLRYIYPGRNIVSFQETQDISSQEGLDTQKKTNGTVNIIGEIATAEAASWIIQTAKVASLFTWGSHHAKTAEDLVTAIRDNLLQTGIFSNEIAAEAAVADVLNVDVHMEKNEDTKSRFMERITEIIPIRDRSYPTDYLEDDSSLTLDEKYKMDMREQARRTTDRKQFTVQNLMEYHDGVYHMVNMPTEAMLADMRSKILPSQRAEFDADMEILRQAVKEYQAQNVA